MALYDGSSSGNIGRTLVFKKIGHFKLKKNGKKRIAKCIHSSHNNSVSFWSRIKLWTSSVNLWQRNGNVASFKKGCQKSLFKIAHINIPHKLSKNACTCIAKTVQNIIFAVLLFIAHTAKARLTMFFLINYKNLLCRQIFFCLQLQADESVQWKMTH